MQHNNTDIDRLERQACDQHDDITCAAKDHTDPVEHPAHYTSAANGVECIDAIFAALGNYKDPIDSWLVGQIFKYLWRAPLKGKYREDISKANFYMQKLMKNCGDKT